MPFWYRLSGLVLAALVLPASFATAQQRAAVAGTEGATLTVDRAAFESSTLAHGRTGSTVVSPVLRSPLPFAVIGPHWSAEHGELDVELRTSRDGTSWSSWAPTGHQERIAKTLEGSDEPNPLAGRWAAGPVLVGPGQRYVQVRVTQPEARGAAPSFEQFSMYAVNVSAGPSAPSVEEEQRFAEEQAAGTARSAPKPRIYTRGEWGARSPRSAWSYATPVTHLAIHYTASTSDGNADTWSECAAAIRGIQNYHMNVNGWSDVGYGYLICPTGAIFQGREDNNDASDVIGAHDSYNRRSASASGLGYFHPPYNQTPPSAMLDGFAELFAWIAGRRGIDPSGSSYYAARGLTISNIYGHRQVISTSCPGNGLYARKGEIIQRTEAILGGGSDGSPGGTPAVALTARWQRNGAVGGRPAWSSTSASTERGLGFGRVGGQDRLFVVTRKDGVRVRVLNAATGADAAWLSTDGVSGGTFALNDVEVTTDGVVFAANLVGNTIEDRFRVYRWDSEAAAPSRVIDFRTWTTPLRLGDKITVVGKASDNSMKLYAPAASGDYVVEFTTADGGRSFSHRFINVASGGALGLNPAVAPFASDFYVASRGQGAKRYDANGSLYGAVPAAAVPPTVGSAKSFADYGASPVRKYLALFDYHQSSSHGGYLRVADVTDGHAGAAPVAQSPWLGGLSNPQGAGDVAVKANGDGTFDLFVLSTNNGLAAFRAAPASGAREVAAAGDAPPTAPKGLALQAVPNPFSSTATLHYTLPVSGAVTLRVYDLLGREVAVLDEGQKAAGAHEAKLQAHGLANGVYVVRLQAGPHTATRRVTLVR